jgi:hypothetical protein
MAWSVRTRTDYSLQWSSPLVIIALLQLLFVDLSLGTQGAPASLGPWKVQDANDVV